MTGWYESEAVPEWLMAFDSGVPLMWFNKQAGAGLGILQPSIEAYDPSLSFDYGAVFLKTLSNQSSSYPEFEDSRWVFPLNPSPDEWADLMVLKL